MVPAHQQPLAQAVWQTTITLAAHLRVQHVQLAHTLPVEQPLLVSIVSLHAPHALHHHRA